MSFAEASLSQDDLLLLKQVGRQYAGMSRALTTIRDKELERMAQAMPDQFLLYKGRIQMLTEIRQLLEAK